jgi:hypothetical protein
VRVEIRLAETTQYIILRPENMIHPLYRIENLSSYSILLRQKPRVSLPSWQRAKITANTSADASYLSALSPSFRRRCSICASSVCYI